MELYAEFAPEQLLAFLSASQSYPLEAALQACKAAGLVREQVRSLGPPLSLGLRAVLRPVLDCTLMCLIQALERTGSCCSHTNFGCCDRSAYWCLRLSVLCVPVPQM